MWSRTGLPTLKEERNAALVARYEQLLASHRHNQMRILILKGEFFLTKQRIIQILKSNNVYNYEKNRTVNEN